MYSDRPEAKTTPAPALVLAGLIGLAIALRFGRLGEWSLDSDEVFLLRDSINVRFTNPRPLLYFLNHYLIAPVLPLDEFGLRLLPAVFGVLAIPAFYFIARQLLGTRAALLGTLLLTLSPLHLILSQFGRYWSLVFLLCAIYPYALYLGARERSPGWLTLGVVTALLASVAHPASILLVGGPAIWFLATQLRPRHLKALWGQPAFRWGVLVAVIVAGAILVRFVPILHGWITEHDTNPGTSQFLLRSPPRPLKPVVFLLAYVETWTIPVVLTGVAGLYLLAQRDRVLALFLTSLVIFPLAFLSLILFRTPVSTYYALPAAPVLFLGAGVFLERVFDVEWRLRPRWLVPAIVLILVLVPGTPTLISQFLNGRRFDFKGAARWLEPRLTAGDIIFSDQPVAMGHYLPGMEVQHLKYNTTPLAESMRKVRELDRGGALWIIGPAPAHAFRTNLKQGGLAQWMYDHCQLSNTVGRSRVDFRQQYLQVYRCPPATTPRPESAAARVGSEESLGRPFLALASRYTRSQRSATRLRP
jgi:Dolichyl-phosphate-mannose-protein mannosyltransferase